MGLHFPVTAEARGFYSTMDGVRRSVHNTMRDVQKSGMTIEQMFENIKKNVTMTFMGLSAAGLVNQIKQVRGEFQQLEIAFKTMLGSEQKANSLMDQLVKTAATTPFDLKGVADGAKMLLAYGTEVENVNEMLVRLGDVAAGMSIQLSDLVYLYGTTMVQGRMFTQDLRQFQGRGIPIAEEIAKVLNVTKNQIPELVTAGKVTADVFHQAFINMTNEGSKFGGLMEAQSKTILGQISNIEDAVDMMFNKMGKESEGAINTVLGGVSYMVENWEEVGKAVATAAVAIGSYKAVMVAVNAVQKVNNALTAEAAVQQALAAAAGHTLTAAQAKQAASEIMLTKVRQSLIVATKELAAATLLNPYVWAAAAITTLVVLTYKLATAEDAETIARRKANDEMKRFVDGLDEQKNKIQGYIHTLQDESATEYDKAEAWEMLNKLAPTLTEKYSKAEVAVMDLAQANRELNQQMNDETFEHVRKRVDELRRNLEETKAAYLSTKDAADAGDVAGVSVTSESDVKRAEALLDVMVNRLVEMERIKKQVFEDAKPFEIKIQEANDNVKAKEEIYGFYRKAADLAGELKEAHDIAAGTIANTSIPKDYERVADDVRNRYDELISELQHDVDDLREKIANTPADISLEVALEEKQKVLDDILGMKAEWDATGATTIPLYFQIHYTNAENAMNDAKSGAREGMYFNAITGQWQKSEKKADVKTAAKWKSEAYGKWKSAEKALNDFYNKKDEIDKEEFDKQVEALQANVEEAKKEYQKYGGSTSAKAKNNDEAKRRAAILQETRRWQEELTKASQDAQTARSEAAVAAIRDDGERERAEQDRQHRQRLMDIAAQAEEMKKAVYEHNKRIWENEHKDGVYEDTEEGKAGWKALSLNKEQQEYVSALLEKENTEYDRLVLERYQNEVQAMRDYIKEYGTLEQQKLAITEEYEEKIRKASSEGERMTLMRQRDSQISGVKARELSQGIDFTQITLGMSRMMDGIAKATYERIREYKKEDEYKKSSPEEKKAIAELERILVEKGAAGSISPFDMGAWKDIDQHIKEYDASIKKVQEKALKHRTAVEEFEDADKKLKDAVARGADEFEQTILAETVNMKDMAVKSTGQELKDAQTEQDNAQGQVVNDFQQLDKGLQDFNTILGEITSGTLSGFANGVTRLVGAITGNKDLVDNALKGLGDKIGGLIGAILSIIDALGEDPAGFIDDLLGKVAKVIEAVIEQIPQIVASVVKGAGNIIAGIGKGIVGMFGLGSLFFGDNKPYEDALDKWQWVLDSWKDTIDYQRELMDKAYGVEAVKTVEEMRQVLERTDSAVREIAKGWLSSGAGLFSRSNEYEANEDVRWDYLSKKWTKELGITTMSIPENLKFLFGDRKFLTEGASVWQLFDLDWKQLEELKRDNAQFWSTLHSDVQNYIDQIIEAGKAAEEAETLLMEKLTTTTEENMFDSFLDSLYNLEDKSEDVFDDIAGNWQKMVNKMLINNVVFDTDMQNNIKNLYKRLSDAMNKRSLGGTNQEFSDTIEGIKADYNRYVAQAQEKIEELRKAGLIMSEAETKGQEQSASVQAMERINTDQAEELIGRLNAGQMLWQQGNDTRDLILASVTAMNDLVAGSNGSLGELVTLMQTANSHLQSIFENNKKIYTEFGEILDKVARDISKL